MVYTIKEAAASLGVTEKTLRRWEAAGKIDPSRNASGYRLYDEYDMLAMRKMVAAPRGDGPRANPQVAKKPVQDMYDIGYGEYPRIAIDDVEYLRASKRRAFDVGYGEPSEAQVAFRAKMMRK